MVGKGKFGSLLGSKNLSGFVEHMTELCFSDKTNTVLYFCGYFGSGSVDRPSFEYHLYPSFLISLP